MASDDSKRTTLSMKEKISVLDELKTSSKKAVAAKYGIGYSTIKKIAKDEHEIRQNAYSNANLSRKRQRASPNEEIGDALIVWFGQMRSQNVSISGPLMIEKAHQLAIELGHDSFEPSHGWLERLKVRNNIKFVGVSGERASADHEGADNWIKNIYPTIISGWDESDIWNADETGLFYRATPTSTLAFSGTQAVGGKTSKDRITALFICNSTGSEKRVVLIGKSKQPRCFKRSKPPLTYYSSANAWMTSWIWNDILSKWDRELGDRKILLFVDNAASHKMDAVLKNITVIFMPPNATSLIQPLDQGIIRATKAHYRTQFMRKMLHAVDVDKIPANKFAQSIDLMTASHMLKRAWFLVTPTTIRNCFRKAGFILSDRDEIDGIVENEVPAVIPGVLPQDVDEFINCDQHLECWGTLTDQEICASVKRTKDDGIVVDSGSEDEMESSAEEQPRMTHSEALKHVAGLRKFFEENATDYDAFYEVEDMVEKMSLLSLKQSKLTDFFH